MSAFIGLFFTCNRRTGSCLFLYASQASSTLEVGMFLPNYGVLCMDCGPIERRPTNRTGFYKGTVKLPAK